MLDQDLDVGALPLLDLDPEAAAGPGSYTRELDVAGSSELEEATRSEVR